MRNTIVALVLGLALVTAGIAWAGDDAPAAKPAAEAKTAPTTVAKKADTATPSPIHSMMKWVGTHVMEGDDCACPSTAKGEAAWRTWFKADSPKLSGLRAAMLKDGWTADKTIGFFKTMAANKSCGEGCNGCDKAKGAAADAGDAGKTGDASGACNGKGCCGKKAKGAAADGAASDTGDAGKTGDAAGGCCKSKKDGGCCKKAKGAAADTGDAGKTGDAAGGCCKGKKDCSGGCDKKSGGCCKNKGAAADAGDAGKTGDASDKCPCTGKDKKDCGGCDNPGCTCGK